jgi:hypothetical protein
MMQSVWEPSPLMRAMNAEREFTADVVRAVGEKEGPALAQRIMARAERGWREDARIVRPMIADALGVLRDENEAAKARA